MQYKDLNQLLKVLAKISLIFSKSLNINEILSQITAEIQNYLQAEAASVFLIEDQQLVCRVCFGELDVSGMKIGLDQGIVGKAVRQGKVQMVQNAYHHPDFLNVVDKLSGFITRSILCAPLQVDGQALGAIELINKTTGDQQFSLNDQYFLEILAASASLAIRNATMTKALLKQERVQKELELAYEIQQNFLPNQRTSADLPVIGINLPIHEVSGDFYDYFALADGQICFALGDVSGKGITASLLMAKTSSLYHCLGKTINSPAQLLSLLNQELFGSMTRGMFVTMVAGLYHPDTDRLIFANAGHQPPLFRSVLGDYQAFPATDIPLGILPNIEYTDEVISLQRGGFYVFSDGLPESLMKQSINLGVEQMKALINQLIHYQPKIRVKQILDLITQSQSEKITDDITLLLVEK